MKISVLLSLLLFTLSCNVVQMVTQGETEVPEDFFRDHKGHQEQYIVFSCGTEICLFDTRGETVQTLTTSAGLSGPEAAMVYNGKLMYTASQSLYEYDVHTGTNDPIDTRMFNMPVEANGKLFYIKSPATTHELATYDGFTTRVSENADYANVHGLGVLRGGTSDRLFMCQTSHVNQMNSSSHFYEIDLTDNTYSTQTIVAAGTVSSTGTSQTYIPCSTLGSVSFLANNRELVTISGNIIQHYNIDDDYLYDNQTTFGGDPYGQFIHDEKAIYYYDGASPYTMYRYDIYSKSLTTITTDASWDAKSVVESPEGKIYHLGRDAGNDELFEYDTNNDTANKLTSFAGSVGTLYNVAVGSRGLYLFTGTGGIYKIEFGSSTPVQVDATNTTAYSFYTFSEDRFNN